MRTSVSIFPATDGGREDVFRRQTDTDLWRAVRQFTDTHSVKLLQSPVDKEIQERMRATSVVRTDTGFDALSTGHSIPIVLDRTRWRDDVCYHRYMGSPGWVAEQLVGQIAQEYAVVTERVGLVFGWVEFGDLDGDGEVRVVLRYQFVPLSTLTMVSETEETKTCTDMTV